MIKSSDNISVIKLKRLKVIFKWMVVGISSFLAVIILALLDHYLNIFKFKLIKYIYEFLNYSYSTCFYMMMCIGVGFAVENEFDQKMKSDLLEKDEHILNLMKIKLAKKFKYIAFLVLLPIIYLFHFERIGMGGLISFLIIIVYLVVIMGYCKLYVWKGNKNYGKKKIDEQEQ